MRLRGVAGVVLVVGLAGCGTAATRSSPPRSSPPAAATVAVSTTVVPATVAPTTAPAPAPTSAPVPVGSAFSTAPAADAAFEGAVRAQDQAASAGMADQAMRTVGQTFCGDLAIDSDLNIVEADTVHYIAEVPGGAQLLAAGYIPAAGSSIPDVNAGRASSAATDPASLMGSPRLDVMVDAAHYLCPAFYVQVNNFIGDQTEG